MFYAIKRKDGLYFAGLFDTNNKFKWSREPQVFYASTNGREILEIINKYYDVELIEIPINEKPLAEPYYKQIIISINSEEEIYQFTTRDFDVKFVYKDSEYSHICLKKPTAKREFTASNGRKVNMDESLYGGSILERCQEIYIGIRNTNDEISYNEFKEAMNAMIEFVNLY